MPVAGNTLGLDFIGKITDAQGKHVGAGEDGVYFQFAPIKTAKPPSFGLVELKPVVLAVDVYVIEHGSSGPFSVLSFNLRPSVSGGLRDGLHSSILTRLQFLPAQVRRCSLGIQRSNRAPRIFRRQSPRFRLHSRPEFCPPRASAFDPENRYRALPRENSHRAEFSGTAKCWF